MRRSAPVVVLSFLLAVAAPLGAQSLVPAVPTDSVATRIAPASDTSSTAVVATPREVIGAPMTGLRAGVHARETALPTQPVRFARVNNQNQARAMMIVGVAALIAGAIIGDTPGTIIMVGGTVVGLIGLYEYLQ
jgi:hypothetical protein